MLDVKEKSINQVPSIARNRLEIIVVIGILVAVLTLELDAVFHGGVQGQDFYQHRYLAAEAAKDPLKWVLQGRRRMDPPIYYLVSAAVMRAAGPEHWLVAIGIINVLQNIAALATLYLVSRLLIGNGLLRIAAICLTAFLPAFVITSVVFSCDPPCQLPPLIMVYFGILGIQRKVGLRTALLVGTLAAAFCIGCKFIALSLIPAFVAATILAVSSRHLSFREAAIGLVVFCGVTIPLQLFFLLQSPSSTAEPIVGNAKIRAMNPPKLQIRSVLFFRQGDWQLLNAPSHWTLALNPKTKPPSFQNRNSYSYPALLCLGTFTDVLDFFQSKAGLSSEPPESYLGGALVGKRSELNQHLMEISVRTGAVIFLAVIVSLPLFLINSLIRTLRLRSQRDLLWAGTFFIAAAWLGFIVSVMPFVFGAYTAGYWLPRLIVPAIMLFVLLFFSGLDRFSFFRRRFVASTLLCLIVAQSLLHSAFLWMRN
jgi:hypothetical protein